MKLLNMILKYSVGTFLTLLVGLVTTPIITRLFSPTEMGKYSMFITLGELVSTFLFLGFDQSFVRFYNDVDESQQSKLLATCLKPTLIAFAVTLIILLPFYKFSSSFIAGEESLNIYLILMFYIICLIFNRFTFLHIRMQQRASTYSAINIIHKLLYVIFAVVFFYINIGNNYYSLILAMTISEILTLIISFLLNIKNYRGIFFCTKRLGVSFKTIVSFGIPFIFSSTVTYVFKATDKVMLNMFTNYKEIGLFSGSLNIISLLNIIQTTFSTFWIPVAYERYKNNPNDKKFFFMVNQVITFIMLVFAICLILFKDIIVFFLGNSYREAVFIFPFLVFMPIMNTISETTVLGINFAKKSKYHICISIIVAISNILGNYFLIGIWGAKGAAVSTGLSYVIFFSLRTYFSNKFYKINYRLKTFYMCISLLYIFAIYSSFNKFNLNILLFSIVLLIIICIAYKNVFFWGIKKLSTTINVIKSKKKIEQIKNNDI